MCFQILFVSIKEWNIMNIFIITCLELLFFPLPQLVLLWTTSSIKRYSITHLKRLKRQAYNRGLDSFCQFICPQWLVQANYMVSYSPDSCLEFFVWSKWKGSFHLWSWSFMNVNWWLVEAIAFHSTWEKGVWCKRKWSQAVAISDERRLDGAPMSSDLCFWSLISPDLFSILKLFLWVHDLPISSHDENPCISKFELHFRNL